MNRRERRGRTTLGRRGVIFIVGILAAASSATAAKSINGKQNEGNKMSYESAVGMLQSPATWCQGAKALAKLGEQRALVPLVQAYRSRAEAEKLCLLEAMEALGAVEAAGRLYDAGGGNRAVGLFLMAYFRDDRHLARLRQAIHDADGDVRREGRRALFAQVQTPQWEDAVLPLLDDSDDDVREEAAEALALNPSQRRREAMRARLAKEQAPAVRARLEAGLR